MQYYPPPAERSKPLLGTFVTLKVRGLAANIAAEAMNRCFAEVGEIHQRMSFQESGSDVSRLNREAHEHPVVVDPRTYEVLRIAAGISEQSDGVFDVTVAPQVVAAHGGAPPSDAPTPDPAARWNDIQLLPGYRVRYLRPLWLDLSGIAKGYAVDRVIAMLSAMSPVQACVNAGGDLRVCGSETEWVRLGVDLRNESVVPMIQLQNESIASSGGRPLLPRDTAPAGSTRCAVAYVDGALQRTMPVRFVSVLAPTCVVADALTKVVMARGSAAGTALRRLGARALLSDGTRGWREVA